MVCEDGYIIYLRCSGELGVGGVELVYERIVGHPRRGSKNMRNRLGLSVSSWIVLQFMWIGGELVLKMRAVK